MTCPNQKSQINAKSELLPDPFFLGKLVGFADKDENGDDVLGTGMWIDKHQNIFQAEGIKPTRNGKGYRNVYSKLPEFFEDGKVYLGVKNVWKQEKAIALLCYYTGYIPQSHRGKKQWPKVAYLDGGYKNLSKENLRWLIDAANIPTCRNVLNNCSLSLSDCPKDSFILSSDPEAKKTKKKMMSKRRYQNRFKRRSIKKSQRRLIKQVINTADDNYIMSKREIKAWVGKNDAYEKQAENSAIGRIKKAENKKTISSIEKKNIRSNILFLQNTKADAILVALAECYNITPASLTKIRTSVKRRKAMIQAGKMWERGRKKKLKPRRKFWKRVYPELPVESEISIITSSQGSLEQYVRLAQRQHTIDNLDLSFLDRPRTVQVFNYDGGYARAGDPRKVETTENMSDRIKAFKAQEQKSAFKIKLSKNQDKKSLEASLECDKSFFKSLVIPDELNPLHFRKHQESQHTSRRKQVLLCPTVTTGTESRSASLSADSQSMA